MTDVTRRQLARAAELADRAVRGVDDPAYCARWARIHATIAEAAITR